MHAGKHHESISRHALCNRRGAVWIGCNNIAPARKLRAVIPVHIQRTATGRCNFDRFQMDALKFRLIKIEGYTRGEIHPVVDRKPAKESARTDPQVVQSVLRHRIMDRGRSISAEIVSDHDRVSAWDDQQCVPAQHRFRHGFELILVGRQKANVETFQDAFNRGNVSGERAFTHIKKHRLGRFHGRR